MRAIPFSASGAVGPAVAASGGTTLLRGFVVTESATTSAAARINIRDGGVVGGAILLPVKLALSSTTIVNFDPPLAVNNACYVEVATGTVVGALFVE